MKGSNRICTYCGLHPGTTRDYVPPKGLFARFRPKLVTVPCCETCRKAQPLDDEYFVRMVSMKSGLHETDSSRDARNAALRSLTKPTKQRFTRAMELMGLLPELMAEVDAALQCVRASWQTRIALRQPM